jgi:hypothetical protein
MGIVKMVYRGGNYTAKMIFAVAKLPVVFSPNDQVNLKCPGEMVKAVNFDLLFIKK